MKKEEKINKDVKKLIDDIMFKKRSERIKKGIENKKKRINDD